MATDQKMHEMPVQDPVDLRRQIMLTDDLIRNTDLQKLGLTVLFQEAPASPDPVYEPLLSQQIQGLLGCREGNFEFPGKYTRGCHRRPGRKRMVLQVPAYLLCKSLAFLFTDFQHGTVRRSY